VGLGLRWDFLDDLLARLEQGTLSLPFVEVAPENYMRRGGYIPETLERVAAKLPLVSHGLTMSIGGLDPYPADYFAQLKGFLTHFDLGWHSDHLCFSGVDGRMLHDLFPLPFTEAAARHAAARVREARERLERPLHVENISYYTVLGAPELAEPDFVSLVLEQADCGLLLDVNNVYVNSLNHGFEPESWLGRIDLGRVVQLHVAGHDWSPDDELYIDTHGATAPDRVHELLSWVIARTGPLPVVLERDHDVPELDALLAEVASLERAYAEGLARHAATRRSA
jgi:uncharacterized protein (UPF0276 family)